MSSQELTAWQALLAVQHEEAERERDRLEDLRETGDGVVYEHNRNPDDDEEREDDEDAGPPE